MTQRTDQNTDKNKDYMRAALEQAKLAMAADEVPIGAIVVERETGEIIGRGFNQTITQSDPSAHAEVLAIRDACGLKGAQRIPECDLYVTLEPCVMCAGAISFARINHIYFGAHDPKSGGLCQGARVFEHAQTHHKPKVTGGILEDVCGPLLSNFFKEKRA